MIKKIYKSKHFPVIFLIILGILAFSFLLYYQNGLLREDFANIVYYKLINSFPKGLSIRTEPFLIALLWFFKKITGLEINQLIMIFRFAVLSLQIYFFYKLAYFFSKHKILSFIFTLIYLCSFSTFAIAENLLRNDLGNLFFLIVLYYSAILISQKQAIKNRLYLIAITGVVLGILTYTHVLPSLIIVVAMIVCIFIYFLISLFRKKPEKSFSVTLKNFTAILGVSTLIMLIGASISLPYLLSLIKAKSGIVDYQDALSSSVVSIQTNINLASSFIVKILRFIFEYRDVSMPVVLMLVVFVGIIYFLYKKNKSLTSVFVVSLWIAVYLGTKLDFLGVGVLPYRFNLMMLVPSLLILILLIKDFLKNIKNDFAKIVILIMIPAVFFAHNLPKVLDVSLLRDYSVQYQEADQLRKNSDLNQFSMSDYKKILVLGTQGLNVFPKVEYMFDASVFQEKDELKTYKKLQKNQVNFVFFDIKLSKSRSQDIGKEIDYSFDKFFNTRYYKKMVESESDFSHTYIFQVKKGPTGSDNYQFGREKIELSASDDSMINYVIQSYKNKSEIEKWEIIAEIGDKSKISERIVFNNQEIVINYPKDLVAKSIKKTDNLIFNSFEINPINLDSRNYQFVNYNLSINSGQMYLKSSSKLASKQLKELSYNQLNLLFKTDKNNLKVSYLNRNQFALAVGYIIAVLTGIVLLLVYLFKFRKKKFKRKKTKLKTIDYVYVSMIVLMTANILFEPYFIDIYKKILGI